MKELFNTVRIARGRDMNLTLEIKLDCEARLRLVVGVRHD